MDLQNEFTTTILELKDDYEGKVCATLVAAKANQKDQPSVLYIHGFVDYFFQAHMAEAFVEKGYNFYALDLRKYGRSLLPHQHPNYCRDMHEYYEEITQSIKIIKQLSTQPLYLFGHSTGGLLSSNYMMDGALRQDVKALMLNSPFFEIKFPKALKPLLYGVVTLISKLFPYAKVDKALAPAYAQSLHKDYHGEWDFDLTWKPIEGFPAYFVWLKAIISAQNSLKEPRLKIPILVMHASQSKDIMNYNEESKSADIVLVVDDIEHIGAQLGDDVTLIAIEDGIHDLFLSQAKVRTVAFEKMFTWLAQH